MSTDEDHIPRQPPFVDPTLEKGYELTGKIMMSAIIIVFSIVVVMVLLHIYARWYIVRSHRRGRRRRTHLVFYVDPDNSASDAVSSRGLDPALLKSLPTFLFSSEKETLQECAVCLSEFEAGEKGRLLPKCNHSFHVDCIDMWFHSHSTCPLCRTAVDGQIPSPKKASDEGLPFEIVVELSESTRSESNRHESGTASGLCTDCRPGPSSSSSLGAKRKGLDLVGVSVDIPARSAANFSFPNSEDLALSSPAIQGFKSPRGPLPSSLPSSISFSPFILPPQLLPTHFRPPSRRAALTFPCFCSAPATAAPPLSPAPIFGPATATTSVLPRHRKTSPVRPLLRRYPTVAAATPTEFHRRRLSCSACPCNCPPAFTQLRPPSLFRPVLHLLRCRPEFGSPRFLRPSG